MNWNDFKKHVFFQRVDGSNSFCKVQMTASLSGLVLSIGTPSKLPTHSYEDSASRQHWHRSPVVGLLLPGTGGLLLLKQGTLLFFSYNIIQKHKIQEDGADWSKQE